MRVVLQDAGFDRVVRESGEVFRLLGRTVGQRHEGIFLGYYHRKYLCLPFSLEYGFFGWAGGRRCYDPDMVGVRIPIFLAALLSSVPAAAQEVRVDLELVLAVDVSQSVDQYEGYLQRLGYIRALEDPRVIESIQGGYLGRIAATYVEWAGEGLWRTVVDWRVIETKAAAFAFAEILSDIGVARGTGTSITSILSHAVTLFESNGYDGDRRVIDISGDGPNSSGGIVIFARDAAVEEGITINGLPINNYDGGNFTLPDLDVYYRECVIGGTGAFVVAADGFESFADAILRKFILEIAHRSPATPELFGVPRIIPAQARGPVPGFDAPPKYAPACDIGERMRLRDRAPPPSPPVAP